MCLCAEQELTETEDTEIQCGIFQEDSLPLLLFCNSLISLIEQLNNMNIEYEEHITKTKILHLLYMDIWNWYVKKNSSKNRCIRVWIFTDGFQTEFRLYNCEKTILKTAKLVHLETLILDVNKEVHELDPKKTYK